MSPKRSRKKVLVRRITVDEKLTDGLIRLVICRLAEGVEEFFDREGDWDKEQEAWARPKNYVRKLGIPSELREEWPWGRLAEGQMFLSGEFEIVEDRTDPKYFKVSPGHQEFLRIDDLEVFKDGVRRIYSELLTRGWKHGESD